MEELLPTVLQQAIERAFTEMLQHPQHALLPFYRRGIYNAIGLLDSSYARHIRAHLALLTARQILQNLEATQPNHNWLTKLLSVTEAVVRGTVSREIAAVQGIAAANCIREDVDCEPGFNLDEEYYFVANAVVEALLESSGQPWFDGAIITQRTTDADLDNWTSDSASWAATAYAGGVWESDSDPVRRKRFWEWWLHKAIPQAWQKTQEAQQ